MDTCHLLLGRPWQYDRRIVHDGFKNTYSFEKDGVKINLGPTKMERPKSSSMEGGNFLSKSEFLIVIGDEIPIYAVVVLEENRDSNEVPLILQPLLQEFHDVIPSDIPPELPPM